MKLRLLTVIMILGLGSMFAQTQYPLVSIHDIQYIDSVDSKGFLNSPLAGDTVRVRGVIMVRPIVDPDTARTPIMYLGARWGTYIQDTATGQYWGGLNVLQNDTTTASQGTFFDLVDTTDIVEFTGVVTPYGQTNELMMLLNPVTPVNIVGSVSKRPDPIQLSVTDFMNNSQMVNGAIKYSGMYVELHNVVSANRNTTTGQFNAYDANGNYVIVYAQSRYFRLNYKLPYSTYNVPADGTPISTIRGIVSLYNNVFEIVPLYPQDITIKAIPPVISNVTRTPVKVTTNTADTIYAKVTDLTARLNSVQLHYKIGNQSRVAVTMTKMTSDTTMYYSVIGGISTDSTLVDYFITASDDSNLTGYTPSDTVKGNYFYQVLDEPLTIRDVQYSPFGSGFSSYNGYYVTLSGIITADTSDFAGRYSANYPKRVYMQNGSGPWTGIMIGTLGLKGVDVLKLKQGDSVTLTGKIAENYSVTAIDSLTSIVVNSSGNTLPASVTVPTGTIGKTASGIVSAEQYESVLINYKNVTVTDENADGNAGPNVSGTNNNYGEFFVSDSTGDTRISLQDGNHDYENDWDTVLNAKPTAIRVLTNAKFDEIQGILYYSYSYYKLCPRKDDDFVNYQVTGVKENTKTLPKSFGLEQNFPNPFNPSTTIRYSIPKESSVTIRIYNILGQEVTTLVNRVKPAGNYEVNFNASRLSSGIYFYSIKAGDYFQVKKMILLK